MDGMSRKKEISLRRGRKQESWEVHGQERDEVKRAREQAECVAV